MKTKIKKILKNDSRLWTDETLNQTLLIDLVEKYDKKIIGLFFNDKNLKKTFFLEVDKAWVFKVRDFVFFMEENKINNSWTDYKNRIGLTDGKRFLKDTNDVVLNFPFKDCILEGGQSTDEGMDAFYQFDEKVSKKEEKLGHKPNQYNLKCSKRKEIFFNQVLAKDEIDRLKDPKALVNWKRYTKDGVQKVGEIKRDENGVIKENLIIKGNNYLALNSLKQQFAGKVKLIYIDPPYNTGNDSFNYNDSFNHSTWLTFMKNRLEVAKDLLSDEGVIFVQCDDNEQAYLKVLMDEIFRKANFLNDIIWNSTKSVTSTAIISVSHTHSLVFFKCKDYYTKNRTEFRLNENGKGFTNPDNDKRGKWKADPFQVGGWRPNQQYEIKNPNTGKIYTPNDNCSWKNDYDKFKILLNDNRIVFGKDGKSAPQRKRFLSEAIERGKVAKTIWNDLDTTTNGTQHLKNLFGKNVFNNPKPENLLQRIVELSTKKGDIILDYHIGSGTTCAVAHKMGRQYIGIEQMDYIEDIAVKRMQKVIEGEQGGISKACDWAGSGEFIYFELAKWNEAAKDKINECQNLEALTQLFDEMYQQYFLNYNLKITEFREKVMLEDNFKNLGLDKQKQMFLTMLDLNQMSVNKSEMADSKYALSKQDQAQTKAFYGDK